MTEPLVKEITVPVSAKRAFDIFTRDIANWWPGASHSLSASAHKLPRNISITPKVGGAITEELHDGTFANWGIISEWDVGKKLVFTWHLRRPEAEQTQVSVEFFPEGDKTRVRLMHWGWDSMGDDAASAREQYNSGWDFVLGDCYAMAAN